MRILIIGSGGREHALAWKLSQSPQKPTLFITPGNGGTAEFGENCMVGPGNIAALMALIKEKEIDFVIPGPELPLVMGIVDACKEAGVLCFGPTKYAAQLEGSKVFSKNTMKAAGVPTASFAVFSDIVAASAYVREKGVPLVIKADGLAAGKGVVVAKTLAEANQALDSMLVARDFGPSGATVLIEDALVGEEVSFLAFCQGDTIIPLPSAQDHKAVFDEDKGPNTGGMGAYSPAPILPEAGYENMVNLAIRPILRQLAQEGHPFSGILYAGIMMTSEGPMVLEYNVRFGDPECQPLLMRMQGDLLEVMLACAQEKLHTVHLDLSPESSLCVVLAAEGYPGPYSKGMAIAGIAEAEKSAAPGRVKVFHAGTEERDGQIIATGGRILGITALGENLLAAQERAYAAMECIRMEHGHFRKDIGNKGLR